MKLTFKNVARKTLLKKLDTPVGYLVNDSWDDYSFGTTFVLSVFDEQGERHDIGSVKIGYFGQEESSTNIPDDFEALTDSFFSLGQSAEYYQSIQSLSVDLKENLLNSLNDVVNNEELLKKALKEKVMKTSLLRSVSISSIKGQFKRLLQGGALLTKYHFKYTIPQSTRVAGMNLTFRVDPESNPPTNVHVLIGRNGVGKTHLLNSMVKALVAYDETEKNVGMFSIPDDVFGFSSSSELLQELFAGVVSVAFSAFDPFEPYPEEKDKSKGVRYSYVGLKRSTNRGGKRGTPMSHEMLTNEFMVSLKSCIAKGKKDLWITAIRNLETDTLFREILLSKQIDIANDEDVDSIAKKVFVKLSSGHAIVLLTITKLVEKVEEKTLVLLDEAEAHLHPPLLSAFIRALSELLSHRNGVAIVATHSPVILQEVPRSCVWKLRRTGLQANAERPEIETFGENVGVLTREIFGLEVTESGYHQLLTKELKKTNSYRKIMGEFNNQLGAEARGILRGLLLAKEQDEG